MALASRSSDLDVSDRFMFKTGSVSIRAGQAMIDIDAIVTNAERVQSVALCGEILLLC
jgi:hypothetical protein